MHFRIDSSPLGGLRVIPEIPAGRLIRIEGRNGIGKSLAVRLLQLCTGFQPYLAHAQSWATLCDNLGKVSIYVTGLKGGHELTFHLDSRRWLDQPEPAGDWLGSAYLDGSQIPWASVSRTLTVRRIAGDETLGESLATQVASDAELVRQLGVSQSKRRHQWQEQIDALLAITVASEPLDLVELRAELLAQKAELAASEQVVTDAESRLTSALEIDRAVSAQQSLAEQAPGLEREIARLQRLEMRLRRELEDLDRRAGEVLAADKRSTRSVQNINRLAGLQRKRYERRERRRRELADLLRAAGLDPSSPERPEPRSLVTQLSKELIRLNERRRTLDRAGLMLEVIDNVDKPLARGRSTGLGAMSLAQLDGTPFSIDQLHAGLLPQRRIYEAASDAEAEEVNQQIQTIQRRLAAANQVSDAMRLLATAEADVAETTQELGIALSAVHLADSNTYQAVYQQRAAKLDELTIAVEDRAQRAAQLTDLHRDGTPEQLRARLAARTAALGMPATTAWDLNASTQLVADLRAEVDRARALRNDAGEALGIVERRLTDAEAIVRTAVDTLETQARFAWVRPQLDLGEVRTASLDEQLASMRRAHAAASQVNDFLLASLNDQQSVAEELGALEQRLKASGAVGLDSSRRAVLTTAVEQRYERLFARELSDEVLRNTLFDGGTDLKVSLRDMTVLWRKGGQLQSRPLEAFSSGERAFAYTRVQIERLVQDRADNRVVFLDEFGSFVAHDRFEQLKRYLQMRALDRAADKIVVILPLRGAPNEEQQDELQLRGGYLVSDLA